MTNELTNNCIHAERERERENLIKQMEGGNYYLISSKTTEREVEGI